MSALLADVAAPLELRYWASVALGRTHNAKALPFLLKAMEDPEPELRTGAMIGLRHMADPRTLDTVIAAATSDSAASVRQASVSTLEAIGSEGAALGLVSIGAGEKEEQSIRIDAFLAASRLARSQSAPALRRAVAESSGPVRTAAAVALASTGDRVAVPELVQAAFSNETPEWLKDDVVRKIEVFATVEFGYVGRNGKRQSQSDKTEALQRVARWWELNRRQYDR
jgi:HEAT repeat protein